MLSSYVSNNPDGQWTLWASIILDVPSTRFVKKERGKKTICYRYRSQRFLIFFSFFRNAQVAQRFDKSMPSFWNFERTSERLAFATAPVRKKTRMRGVLYSINVVAINNSVERKFLGKKKSPSYNISLNFYFRRVLLLHTFYRNNRLED